MRGKRQRTLVSSTNSTLDIERRRPGVAPSATALTPALSQGERGCVQRRTASNGKGSRRGLSLFEVLISLAIFAVSVVAIGQLVATGTRGALRARRETEAVFRCESKLSEVIAGSVALQSAQGVPFEDDPDWTWSVALGASPQEGMYLVAVTVSHGGSALGSFDYTLERLVRDPEVALLRAQQLADLQAQQQASQSSSSSGSSSGASNGSSSGGSR